MPAQPLLISGTLSITHFDAKRFNINQLNLDDSSSFIEMQRGIGMRHFIYVRNCGLRFQPSVPSTIRMNLRESDVMNPKFLQRRSSLISTFHIGHLLRNLIHEDMWIGAERYDYNKWRWVDDRADMTFKNWKDSNT